MDTNTGSTTTMSLNDNNNSNNNNDQPKPSGKGKGREQDTSATDGVKRPSRTGHGNPTHSHNQYQDQRTLAHQQNGKSVD